MLSKFKLVPSLLAISAVFIFASSAMARCIFRMDAGGPILICPTCNCADMKDAGVNWDRCLDFMVKPNEPKSTVDKIVRYSDTNVTIRYADGSETPLASDESQKQFEAIVASTPTGGHANLKERLQGFKARPGVIGRARCNELAKALGVEIQKGHNAGPGQTERTDPIKRPNN